LEYVRWALCDLPPADVGGNDIPDFQKRRQTLIEGTLLPLGAVVDIFFVLNDVQHVVRRKASGELTLKIGDAGFQSCTEQNVRELLQVRAYSQKQLSAVGARLDELRRFVHSPIQADLDAIEDDIRGLVVYLRTQFDRVIRQRALHKEVSAHDIEITSLNQQLDRLRSSLKGLSEQDRAIIARQANYEREQRVVQSMERDAGSERTALEGLTEELMRLPTPLNSADTLVNSEVLQQAHKALEEWTTGARQAVETLLNAFSESTATTPLAGYFAGLATWRKRREAHRQEYEQAKVRAASHEETLRQIRTLEQRLAEINEAADGKKQQLARLGDPMSDFRASRAELKAVHGKRTEMLEKQCKVLTAIPHSRLKATLKRAADIEPLANAMRELLKGTKTRGERVDQLMQQISTAADPLLAGSTDPFELWHSILDELHEFAWVTVDDEAVAQLPASPRLDAAGFSTKEKIALARQLKPAAWLDLLLFDLKDLPVFDYEIREDDFIPFENASPGQQATALLSILLLQDGPPLLIDRKR